LKKGSQPKLSIFSSPTLLSQAAAELVLRAVKETLQTQDRVTLCLSGGSTPREFYSLLACEPYCGQIPWEKVHIFWGDERHIPLSEPDNHYRMAMDLFLSKVPIPSENIHRVLVETSEPDEVAKQYESEIKAFFGVLREAVPAFDVVFLGMGSDGHTASLFPETTAVKEGTRWVVSNFVPRRGLTRITLTFPILNQARNIVFLVSGSSKAEMLRSVLQGSQNASLFPAQLIRPESGHLMWFVDQDAGSQLDGIEEAQIA
jgi:6-phosphogluconolactonase